MWHQRIKKQLNNWKNKKMKLRYSFSDLFLNLKYSFNYWLLDCSVPPQRDVVDRVEASVVLSGESTSIFYSIKNTYYFDI